MTTVQAKHNTLLESFPPAQRARAQWLCWRYETRGEKTTKVPYNALTGKKAKSNTAETWATFDRALDAFTHSHNRYNGVGYVFAGDETGVDLDHCINEQGEIDAWAQDFIDRFASYSERSPSGTGVHIYLVGSLPDRGTRKKIAGQRDPNAAIELYSQGRYFTVTGDHLPETPATVEDRQDVLTQVYAEIARESERPQKKAADPLPHSLSDSQLLEKARAAKNGAKFAALYDRGDTGGYLSSSEADLALCILLAFWTGNDAASVDRLFRRSALMRDKWDEQHGAQTYGDMTIGQAIAQNSETYIGWVPLPIDEESAPQRQNGKNGARPAAVQEEIDLDFIVQCAAGGEYDDALLFARLFRGKVIYDHSADEWYFFHHHHWQLDTLAKIRHLVSGELASTYIYAAGKLNLKVKAEAGKGEEDEEAEVKKLKATIKMLTTRATSLRMVGRCNNVLRYAGSMEGLGLTSDQWDTHNWILPVQNGVLDLKTGKLRDGQPGDYIRTVSPTTWAGLDAPAPYWTRVLNEAFEDREENDRARLLNFLQRFLGFGITGLVNEHVFLVMFGDEGRNGKDTIIHAMHHALGKLAGAISNDVLLSSGKFRQAGSATPHLVDLQGKRLAWASEPSSGSRFDIAQVKQLTGGGSISARQNYGKQYEFAPTHKLILLTNHKPHADATDKAFWERLRLIAFNMRFVDNPKLPNERKKDATLWSKLEEEAPGILAWLVRGCLAWQREGMNAPACVLQAVEAYRASEDNIGLFLDECCVLGDQLTARARRLYEIYREWCKAGNLYTLDANRFGEHLAKRFTKEKDRKGWFYRGIGILDPESSPDFHTESQNVTASDGGRHTSQHDEKPPAARREDTSTVGLCDGVTPILSKLPDSRENNLESGDLSRIGVTAVTKPNYASVLKPPAARREDTSTVEKSAVTRRHTLSQEKIESLLASLRSVFVSQGTTEPFWRLHKAQYRSDNISREEYITRLRLLLAGDDDQACREAMQDIESRLEKTQA